MIVRPAGASVHLITQPDHAHLAARIIEHDVALAKRPRRDAILLAVAEHDNGWTEEDAAPILNSTGYVADFVNVTLAVRHRVWPRAIQRLEQHPWTAALVAEHAVVVYDRFRSETGWTPFFASMEAARDRMVRASGLSYNELVSDYTFLRLADLISLVFCMAAPEAQHFGQWSVEFTGDRVVVSPNPFGDVTIPIEIRAREMLDQPFRSEEELHATIKSASTVILRGAVS